MPILHVCRVFLQDKKDRIMDRELFALSQVFRTFSLLVENQIRNNECRPHPKTEFNNACRVNVWNGKICETTYKDCRDLEGVKKLLKLAKEKDIHIEFNGLGIDGKEFKITPYQDKIQLTVAGVKLDLEKPYNGDRDYPLKAVNKPNWHYGY